MQVWMLLWTLWLLLVLVLQGNGAWPLALLFLLEAQSHGKWFAWMTSCVFSLLLCIYWIHEAYEVSVIFWVELFLAVVYMLCLYHCFQEVSFSLVYLKSYYKKNKRKRRGEHAIKLCCPCGNFFLVSCPKFRFKDFITVLPCEETICIHTYHVECTTLHPFWQDCNTLHAVLLLRKKVNHMLIY